MTETQPEYYGRGACDKCGHSEEFGPKLYKFDSSDPPRKLLICKHCYQEINRDQAASHERGRAGAD